MERATLAPAMGRRSSRSDHDEALGEAYRNERRASRIRPLDRLVQLQRADGSWPASKELAELTGVSPEIFVRLAEKSRRVRGLLESGRDLFRELDARVDDLRADVPEGALPPNRLGDEVFNLLRRDSLNAPRFLGYSLNERLAHVVAVAPAV